MANTDEEQQTIRVIFCGRRVLSDGRLAHVFAPEASPTSEGAFRFRKGGWVVGGIYEANGTIVDGALDRLSRPSSWTGERVDQAQAAAWELLDRHAQHTDAARRAEDRAKRSPAYQGVIAAASPVMANAHTYRDAERLADALKWALLEEWNKQGRK